MSCLLVRECIWCAGDDRIYKQCHIGPNIHEFASAWAQLSDKVKDYCNKVPQEQWAQHVHRAVLDGKSTQNDSESMNHRWGHARSCPNSLSSLVSVVTTEQKRWGDHKCDAHACSVRDFPEKVEKKIAAQQTRIEKYNVFKEPARPIDNSQLRYKVVCPSEPSLRFNCNISVTMTTSAQGEQRPTLEVDCECGYPNLTGLPCDCAMVAISRGTILQARDAVPLRRTSEFWQKQYPLDKGA